MLNSYLTIPLNCEKLTQKLRQPKCTLADSLRQHIHLIIRTHFNESRFDNEYGCMIWEKDFETIRSVDKWKTELLDSFQKSLKKYEVRLSNIQVVVNLDDLKIVDPKTRKVVELRRRINIHIEGIIRQTNESFQHQEFIFFSPLSLT
ncbi:GPW/gp25 family protein [Pontibacter saemangeumensis]